MKSDLDALFRPKSVALIGASAHPEKMGHIALRNLSAGKFRLYPVNPNESKILGLKCYPSVLDIPGGIDLAIVSLPARASVEPVRECVAKGARVVVVTSSGFRESGAGGNALENELLSIIRGSGTRLLGPNTMGILVPSIGLDTMFIPKERSPRPKSGSVGMLSQSGAVSIAFLEKAESSGVGVSACVGLGNKADINENDLMDYLATDSSTKCIALYLESFADGRKFLEEAIAVGRTKPLVVLKAGRTRAGVSAAKSHTGAMASADALVDAALKQAGVVRVYDEEELLDIAKALALIDHTDGERVCIVASAGGFGVIAADFVESDVHGAKLKMARLSRKTEQSLKSAVPEFSSFHNPIDLTAGVTDEMYDSVLEILQEDTNVDCIMMSLKLQPPHITDRLIDIAESRALSGETPIVVSAFAGDRTNAVIKEFAKRGVPAYPTIWRAIRAIRALSDRGHYLRRLE